MEESQQYREKTRDLSTMDYLETLQREWWICNLRRKIYPALADKKFYNRTANLKRDRIKNIAERNNIDCIFTNVDMMKALNKEFMRLGGVPIFDGMLEQDLINYYLPENDVRCFYGFELGKPIVKIGKVFSFDINKRIVSVKFLDGSVEDLQVTKVSRIV